MHKPKSLFMRAFSNKNDVHEDKHRRAVTYPKTVSGLWPLLILLGLLLAVVLMHWLRTSN